MAFTPLNVDAAIGDNVKVVKESVRNLFEECQDRLGDLPANYGGYTTCEVVALGAPGNGPAPASDGTLPVTFAGRPIGDYATDDVEIDGNITLTGKLHSGRVLQKNSGTASILYLEPTGDRNTGVQRGFSCSVWSEPGAGRVQVISSMNNVHPSGHQYVQSGGIATIVCNPVRLIWRLAGETEV